MTSNSKSSRKKTAVLGIVGSPRRGANTEILVDEILAAAKEAGATTEKIILSELRIEPCAACYSCRDKGMCVKDDDMIPLYAKMEECGVWVIGTPVYWWGPSAQSKAFVDRWFAKGGTGRKKFFGRKKVILAIPLGDGDRRTARHVVGMFKDALDYVGSELFGTVIAAGAYEPGEVRNLKNAIRKARNLGFEVIRKRTKRR